MKLEFTLTQHYQWGTVYQSKKLFGNSVPIQFFILVHPHIQVVANVASNACVYKYTNDFFDSIHEAEEFCQEEFDGFCRGESLNV